VNALPSWLVDVLVCPEDGGALQRGDSALTCASCGRVFAPREGVLELLPDRLAHVAAGAAGTGADASAEWIDDELRWWNPWFESVSAAPLSPRSGLRGRSRELHLLRHVRARLGPSPVVIEMGAGTSRTIAGLWPPSGKGLRYVATDISPAALRAGRANLGPGAASVQCDAVAWPVREEAADVVLILGVLHHLSDWPAALNHACRTVRPGGFLLMHEAVSKPRVLGRFRSEGVDDHWVSPHEGDVPEERLRAELETRGSVRHWHRELSPLRFGLERWLINKRGLDDRLERSRAMTMAFNGADQAFGRTFGRVAPSLGFNEVSVVWQRAR
jgi:SAM-dependent methyltransferase